MLNETKTRLLKLEPIDFIKWCLKKLHSKEMTIEQYNKLHGWYFGIKNKEQTIFDDALNILGGEIVE